MLYDPDGISFFLSFRHEFPCTTNVAEYEALLIELISTLQMGIQKVRIQGDSKLVVQQINSEFALKESDLTSYKGAVQKLVKPVSSTQFEHITRSHNKHADVLETLASKVDVAMRQSG